ncbi:hypothetical protein HDU86_001018 [Geranomyces michiganensis]|nr:hypothetical protein HDU86_001018 [Geranomyces michiganensis]
MLPSGSRTFPHSSSTADDRERTSTTIGAGTLPGVETRWPRRGALTGTHRDFEALFAAKMPAATASGGATMGSGGGGGDGDGDVDPRRGGKPRTFRILSSAGGNEPGWKASRRTSSNKRTVFVFAGKDWDLTDLKEIALSRTSISKMTPAFTLIIESDKFDTFLTKGTLYARWYVRTLVVEKSRSMNKLGMIEIQQTRRTSGLSDAAKHTLFGGEAMTAEQCTAGRNAALKEFAFAYCFLLLFVSSHSQAPAKERMYFEYIYIFTKEIIATILGLPSFASAVGSELERLFRSGLFQNLDAGIMTAAAVPAVPVAGGVAGVGLPTTVVPGATGAAAAAAAADSSFGVSDFRIAKLLGTSRDAASAGARKRGGGGGAGGARGGLVSGGARSALRSAPARKGTNGAAPAAGGARNMRSGGRPGSSRLRGGVGMAAGGSGGDAGPGGAAAAAAAAAWAAMAGGGVPVVTAGGWIKSEEGGGGGGHHHHHPSNVQHQAHQAHQHLHHLHPAVAATANPAAAALTAASAVATATPSVGAVIDPYAVTTADADDASDNDDDARHHLNDGEDEPETQSRPIRSAALRERERLRRR